MLISYGRSAEVTIIATTLISKPHFHHQLMWVTTGHPISRLPVFLLGCVAGQARLLHSSTNAPSSSSTNTPSSTSITPFSPLPRHLSPLPCSWLAELFPWWGAGQEETTEELEERWRWRVDRSAVVMVAVMASWYSWRPWLSTHLIHNMNIMGQFLFVNLQVAIASFS